MDRAKRKEERERARSRERRIEELREREREKRKEIEKYKGGVELSTIDRISTDPSPRTLDLYNKKKKVLLKELSPNFSKYDQSNSSNSSNENLI